MFLGGMHPILNDVQVPIIDQEECKKYYSIYPEYPITDNMICMGIDEGTGVCTVSISPPMMSPVCLYTRYGKGINRFGYETTLR